MKYLLPILAIVSLMAISFHASATTVQPTPTVVFDNLAGDEITITCGTDVECFADVGLTPLAYGTVTETNVEYGPFADNYKFNGSHTQSNNKVMIENATVTPLTCPSCFLVLTGADAGDDPWTIDISAWDGMSKLYINDFYLGDDDRTGVATVEIYGVSAVPIPAAAWLFGSGLLGLVAVGRRKTVV